MIAASVELRFALRPMQKLTIIAKYNHEISIFQPLITWIHQIELFTIFIRIVFFWNKEHKNNEKVDHDREKQTTSRNLFFEPIFHNLLYLSI